MKIYDNFLSENDWKTLQHTFTTTRFPWVFGIKTANYDSGPNKGRIPSTYDLIEGNVEIDFENTQLTHIFYKGLSGSGIHVSDQWRLVTPILDKFTILGMNRIKANLQICRPNHVVSDYHYDSAYFDQEKQMYVPDPEITTMIYYINTNNGYTEFEDGTKVASVENRLLLFPNANPKGRHRGISQTDAHYRSVINFNLYLSRRHKLWKD